MKCEQCPVRHRAVCAQSEWDDLGQLESMKFYRSFEPGQLITCEGDRMDFVASVVSGAATLTRITEDGRAQIVGLLLPGDFLGRPGRETAAFNAAAVSKLVLCCFRHKPFNEMMQKTPQIARRLLQMSLDELDAARDWMLLLGRKLAREKIASFLLIIAKREAALHNSQLGGRMEVELPLSRAAMADYLGLTLETVSRQISALNREGIIELTDKRLVILPDFGLLANEAGGDSPGVWII